MSPQLVSGVKKQAGAKGMLLANSAQLDFGIVAGVEKDDVVAEEEIGGAQANEMIVAGEEEVAIGENGGFLHDDLPRVDVARCLM